MHKIHLVGAHGTGAPKKKTHRTKTKKNCHGVESEFCFVFLLFKSNESNQWNESISSNRTGETSRDGIDTTYPHLTSGKRIKSPYTIVFTAGAKGSGAVTDGAAGAVEKARRRFLPFMRPDASTPEGVYSAGDIASDQELQALERQVDRAAEGCEVRVREET